MGVALTNPEIVTDNKRFSALSKEYRNLEKIVNVIDAYKRILDDIEFNKEVLNVGMMKKCVKWPNWNCRNWKSKKEELQGKDFAQYADSQRSV